MRTATPLEQIFERSQKDEVFFLGKMQIPEQKNFYAGSFKTLNRENAGFYATIKKDYDKAKECYYKAGMTGSLPVRKAWHGCVRNY